MWLKMEFMPEYAHVRRGYTRIPGGLPRGIVGDSCNIVRRIACWEAELKVRIPSNL
jgi:hypothetical protein